MNANTLCQRLLACLAAASMVFAVSPKTSADDPVFSGPQVGERLTPFDVVSVYGETAGTVVDPIKTADGGPTMLVFVHKLTRPGIALARALTGYVMTQGEYGAKTGVVWLDDDKAKAEAYLTRAAGSLQFVAPVGVSVDGGEGPGAYGLNRNVELTILVANENTVKANFALVQPSVTEAAGIASELAKLVDQPPPEQKLLESFAYPGNKMTANRSMNNAEAKRDKAGPRSDELRTMMKTLLVRNIEKEDSEKAITSIQTWVGDDKSRKAKLAKMVDAVLQRGMGGEIAQAQLMKWKREYSDVKTQEAKTQ